MSLREYKSKPMFLKVYALNFTVRD